jgi:hypothetical protein
MNFYVYLDQNTLSDLRERKLRESDDEGLRKIREIFYKDSIRLVYSETHLQEILQISNAEYRMEHVDLLSELRGVYINPVSTKLIYEDPNVVWLDFLKNESENEVGGIKKVSYVFDRINRKISGLPVDESFEDLEFQLKKHLKSMLQSAENELNNLDSDLLFGYEVEEIKKQKITMGECLAAVSNISIPYLRGELGPKPVRNLEKLKVLQLHSLPDELVISKIDEIFTRENSGFHWLDYFDDTIPNQIARCYSLMNWVGYYADDFTRTKKNKDRFRASNNDLMHVRNAVVANLLISKDFAFIKKAKACYAHLGVNTVVINANELSK